MSIVGFTRIGNSYIFYCLVVKGARCYQVPLTFPFYHLIYFLWKIKVRRRLIKLRSL